MNDIKNCKSCKSATTYIYDGRPVWHNTTEGTLCHKCYCEKYRASHKPKPKAEAIADAFDALSTNGGDLNTTEKKIELLEMKCANPMCSNRIFIAGTPKMSIDGIEANCNDCQLVSTYKKKKEKATEVKRIIDGQLRLDTSLEKDDE